MFEPLNALAVTENVLLVVPFIVIQLPIEVVGHGGSDDQTTILGLTF
jgi:hypothetical protein